ncbi:hypothetical protein M758_2G228100 [Ceratodon purpureus]|nr:hypothetical protein M758_2G228100 [Ceratodon purpureus]
MGSCGEICRSLSWDDLDRLGVALAASQQSPDDHIITGAHSNFSPRNTLEESKMTVTWHNSALHIGRKKKREAKTAWFYCEASELLKVDAVFEILNLQQTFAQQF